RSSRMRSSAPFTARGRSRSSMRTRNSPPAARAVSHATSAVRAPPRCKSPVGEGANRPLYIEAEMRGVVVAHHVLFAFDGQLGRRPAGGFRAQLHQVLPPDDLGLDEAFFEVGVDDASRLRRPG